MCILYEDIQDVVRIQDCNPRHGSHIPTERSKALEVSMESQKRRLSSESWGNTWVWGRDKSRSSNMGWGTLVRRNSKLAAYQQKKASEKKKSWKIRLGRGHSIWHGEAIVNFLKSSLSRAVDVEVQLKCNKKWKKGEGVLIVFFFPLVSGVKGRLHLE